MRADEGMGGVDAIRIGVLWQQVGERVRTYRAMVNVGEEPTYRAWLADADADGASRSGLRLRSSRALDTGVHIH